VQGAARGGFARALERAWWRSKPCLLSWLLWPSSWIYRAVANLDRLSVRPQRLDRPVVVVGNLVVGGAGKTPTTIALVRLLQAQGWTPGVVSRGYGRTGDGVVEVGPQRRADEVGDEPLLIRRRAQVPVFVGRDRVAAAQALRQVHPEVDVIVSDDGLQHHRLARDLQVIVFDERGPGNGLCLPAGPLRAPLPASVPPRTLLLYNAPAPSTPLPGFAAARRLAGVLPLADWQRGLPVSHDGWQVLQGRRVLAVAGIAAPARFFAMLRALGLELDERPLPDHHDFATLPWPDDAALDVVLTEKDAVKLAAAQAGASSKARVWVAPLDFEPEPAFGAALERLLPRTDPRR
jgi:tetraacyldisaccharide 4'-kinase